MAAEQLQIQVSANVSNAIKGLNDLEKGLKSTETAGVKLGSQGLPQVSKGANQANIAMINLGRTVSDAPFGFIGIANNIGPLVENFVSLKKEAGSTGGALKQLGTSLIGPGGLIVGIQLVVAAVQFAQLGLQRWGSSSKKTKEEQDKLKQGTESLIETVTKQRLEVESLAKVAKDVTQSELARNQALQKLNEILPDTIGKLNQQNIATEQGAAIIENYIKAVEARATAELLAGRIAANNVKIFDAQNELNKERAQQQSIIQKNEAQIQSLATKGTANAQAFVGLSESIERSKNRILEIESKNNAIINQAIEENNRLRNEYERQIPVINTLNDKKVKGSNKEKTLQEKVNELLSDYKNTLQSISYEEQIRGINQSNERLETNLDFLKRAADLVGFTGKAYRTISADTKRFADAASNQKIVDVIKNYNLALSELDIKQAVTGQDQLNAKINAATDALIKLKQLGVAETNAEFIKLQNTLNNLQAEVALNEIKKQAKEISDIWKKLGIDVNELNFNRTRGGLDILKSKIDLITNAIVNLKSKGLTESDLGIELLRTKVSELADQFDRLRERKEVLDSITGVVQNDLTNAFTSVFEAIIKGEDAFKVLERAIQNLVIEVTAAIVKMLILKAISAAIGGGAGGGAVMSIAERLAGAQSNLNVGKIRADNLRFFQNLR